MLLGLALLVCGRCEAEDRAVSEYQVKAAFLYNFTKFVIWPKEAFATNNSPLTIGIVGDDPFGKSLDDVVRGEQISGHPLIVKRFRLDQDFTGCQLLFASRSIKDDLNTFVRQVGHRPILTIGDTAGFGRQGVMATLLLVNGNIKMEINRNAAEMAGLQISAKLLGLARIVESDRGVFEP